MKKNIVKCKTNEIIVSVIIPTYNMVDCISDCLDSILHQRIDKMEIIVVDDGSHDGIKKVINKYLFKNNNITPIYLEKNLGVSNARNIGIGVARGEYIHYVDADDSVPADVYKKMIKCVFENHTDIIVGNYIFKSSTDSAQILYTSNSGLSRCLENNNLSLWNKWFKKSFIVENDLQLDTDMKTAEDAMFCLRALRKNPSISYTDNFIYQYLYDDKDKGRHCGRDLHISSISSSLKVLKENFTEEFPEETEDLWRQAYINYVKFIYNNLWRKMYDCREKEEAYCKMQEVFNYVHDQNTILNLNSEDIYLQFVNIFLCDYFTFQSLNYSQYMMLLSIKQPSGIIAHVNVSQRFVNECAQGQIGMRTILRSVRAWLKWKLFK